MALVQVPRLNTPRLLLRPIELQDAAAIHECYRDTGSMKFMRYKPHVTVEETRKDILREIEGGSKYWAICLKQETGDEGRCIGKVGVLGQVGVPGLGYIVAKDVWARGYATEATRAVIDFVFNSEVTRQIDRLELWIHEGNGGSRRVAEKLGFRIKGRLFQRLDWENAYHYLLVYGLYRDEWLPQCTTSSSASPLSGKVLCIQPVLSTTDILATVAFYESHLGFRQDFVFRDDTGKASHCAMSGGDFSGAPTTLQFSLVEEAEDGTLTSFKPCTLYVHVDQGLPAFFSRLSAANDEVVITKQLERKPWGMSEFEMLDNNGHVLRFGSSMPDDAT